MTVTPSEPHWDLDAETPHVREGFNTHVLDEDGVRPLDEDPREQAENLREGFTGPQWSIWLELFGPKKYQDATRELIYLGTKDGLHFYKDYADKQFQLPTAEEFERYDTEWALWWAERDKLADEHVPVRRHFWSRPSAAPSPTWKPTPLPEHTMWYSQAERLAAMRQERVLSAGMNPDVRNTVIAAGAFYGIQKMRERGKAKHAEYMAGWDKTRQMMADNEKSFNERFQQR